MSGVATGRKRSARTYAAYSPAGQDRMVHYRSGRWSSRRFRAPARAGRRRRATATAHISALTLVGVLWLMPLGGMTRKSDETRFSP
jgi:hypothetical protein